jgi:hypothetical protein
MVLSKSDIINGTDSYQEVEIKSANDTIYVRPLSIGEIHQIQEMKDKALGDYIANQKGASRRRVKETLEAQAKINVGKQTVASNKADVRTVLWGLDNEGNDDKYTEEDINHMDSTIFEEILEHVKRISHMEDEDVEKDVDTFPEDE